MFDFSLINGLKVGIEHLMVTVCEEDEWSEPEFFQVPSIHVHLLIFTVTWIIM
jgi:hypothetical protein